MQFICKKLAKKKLQNCRNEEKIHTVQAQTHNVMMMLSSFATNECTRIAKRKRPVFFFIARYDSKQMHSCISLSRFKHMNCTRTKSFCQIRIITIVIWWFSFCYYYSHYHIHLEYFVLCVLFLLPSSSS